MTASVKLQKHFSSVIAFLALKVCQTLDFVLSVVHVLRLASKWQTNLGTTAPFNEYDSLIITLYLILTVSIIQNTRHIKRAAREAFHLLL